MQEKLPCKQIITSVGSELRTIPKLEVKQRVAPTVLNFNSSLATPGVNEGGKRGFSTTRGRNEFHVICAVGFKCDLKTNQWLWIPKKNDS